MQNDSPQTTPLLFRVGDKPGYHSGGIPWKMIARHEAQADRNHSQTLRGLHDRGGLVWSEALAVLRDRPWEHNSNAKAVVLALVEAWDKEQMDASNGA